MTTLLDLKNTLTDTDADQVLEDLIARSLDAIQRELDWYFGEPRAAVEVLNGTGLRALWLRQYIVAGTSVVVRERTDVGDDWEVVSADEYEYDEGGRGVFNVGDWTRGVRNYRVEYTEGFLTMPGDVEQLLLELIVSRWENREEDTAMKSERIGDYAYTRADLEQMGSWAVVWNHWKRGRI